MRIYRAFLSLSVVVLGACKGINPVLDTASGLWRVNDFEPKAGFEYIQVSINSRSTLLAIGKRVRTGAFADEYWYSGAGEMLYLRNGRLMQAVGLTKEIRTTSIEMLDFEDVQKTPIVWSRTRDLMPGYLMENIQYVTSKQVDPVDKHFLKAPNASKWIEEQINTKNNAGQDITYVEIFAVDVTGVVVFSRQCIAHDLCLELKPLGVLKK